MIWTPFVHSFPFDANQITDRITVFGLYANSYLNGHKYLKEIEDEDLANLLTDYNYKISDLTAQEQRILTDITSKRYLASIDKLLHDQKMATKQAEIDADSATMDAKIAALSADRAAVTTMAAKVSSETTKIAARITELEAYIDLEGINLSEVDIDIAQKELQSARIDNEKLNMQNEILRLQVETVETAMQLIDIDLKISRTAVDVAETERAIARIGLLADDLTIAQAQTAIEQAGIPISAARIALAQAKYDDVEAEKTYIETTLHNQATELLADKTDVEGMRQTARLNEIANKIETQDAASDLDKEKSAFGIGLAEADQTIQGMIDDLDVTKSGQMTALKHSYLQARIAAKKIEAAATIASELTHVIRKA